MITQFKIGKYYVHPTGVCMHIIGAVKSTLYGWTLVGERHGKGDFISVGSDAASAVNWKETTEEHWMSGFSK